VPELVFGMSGDAEIFGELTAFIVEQRLDGC
jgi:hypothetical protein